MELFMLHEIFQITKQNFKKIYGIRKWDLPIKFDNMT
jgi:hypothetical protein